MCFGGSGGGAVSAGFNVFFGGVRRSNLMMKEVESEYSVLEDS